MAESEKNRGKKMVSRHLIGQILLQSPSFSRREGNIPKMKFLSAVKTKLSLAILGFSGDIFSLSISQWLLISWFK